MKSTALHKLPSWLFNDIAWLGTTQGLLRDNPSSLELIRQTCSSLLEDDIQVSEDQVSVLTNKRRGPLGRYFEALVQTLISLSQQVENFHPNVVIHDGERTRGELDLLYELTGRWFHLELAVKFYIGLDDRSDQFQWHGPAAHDTLGRKLNRLLGHQLRLPETESGRFALASLNIGEVHSEALVMGMLFHPYAAWQEENFEAPAMVAEKHPTGWWLRRSDINRLLDIPEVMWKVLTKPEWLSPTQPMHGEMLDGNALSEQVQAALPPYPIMVAALIDGEERHRGFLLTDDWPPLQAILPCGTNG